MLVMTLVSGCGGASGSQRWHDNGPDDSAPGTTSSPSADPPAPTPAPTGGPSTRPGDYIARLPKFGPAPPPQPVAIAPGPTAPIFKRLPVNQPVAFLTIDDGWFQLPDDPRIMQAAHIPFTMFLIAPVAGRNPAFFQQLEGYGGGGAEQTQHPPQPEGERYPVQLHAGCHAGTCPAAHF